MKLRFCWSFFVVTTLCLWSSHHCDELLRIYPLKSLTMATVNFHANDTGMQATPKMETVVVLDVSYSMGSEVERIVNYILPAFFRKLKYGEDEKIHLITFSNNADHRHERIRDFPSIGGFQKQNTYMTPALGELRRLMKGFERDSIDAVRILTISDGQIKNKEETKTAADELNAYAKSFSISISSQAVRWETKDADTTALCSLQQLGTVNKNPMIDSKKSETNEAIVDAWASLFTGDELTKKLRFITSSKNNLLSKPWEGSPLNKLLLKEGSNNTIWITELGGDVWVDEVSINMTEVSNMTYQTLYDVLKDMLGDTIDEIKQKKVIDSQDSRDTMQMIVDYFKAVEEELPPPNGTMTISTLLDKIAKDDSIAGMNAQQRAEYLKNRTYEGILDDLKPTSVVVGPKKKEKIDEAGKEGHAEEQVQKRVREKRFITTKAGVVTVAVGAFVGASLVFGLAFTLPIVLL